MRWITRQRESMRITPLGFCLRVIVNKKPLNLDVSKPWSLYCIFFVSKPWSLDCIFSVSKPWYLDCIFSVSKPWYLDCIFSVSKPWSLDWIFSVSKPWSLNCFIFVCFLPGLFYVFKLIRSCMFFVLCKLLLIK